jgi:lipopolysaccharide transport system ATP-binding protein
MSEVLIKAEGVGKKFSKTLKHSMLYGLQDIARNLTGMSAGESKLRQGEFWSLNDVSFELRRGECFGLIGPNGAGKSTLLKLLNGILTPDSGRIELRGRVAALIELGAGFHPQLTGRENIYVNGAILGLRKEEVDRKLEAIINFSELGDFIDTPVKFYSSGMYVRLGFAVASQVEPDVLLIDEVLAVGDAGFRAKCYDAIYSRLQNSAVIVVSHNMTQISRMCSSVVLLENGRHRLFSSPHYGIDAYNDVSFSSASDQGLHHSNGKAELVNLLIRGCRSDGHIVTEGACEVMFDLRVSPEISSCSILLSVLSREHQPVAYCKKKIENGPHDMMRSVRFIMPHMVLAPGKYSLAIAVMNEDRVEQLLWDYNVAPFVVAGNDDFVGVSVALQGEWDISGFGLDGVE